MRRVADVVLQPRARGSAVERLVPVRCESVADLVHDSLVGKLALQACYPSRVVAEFSGHESLAEKGPAEPPDATATARWRPHTSLLAVRAQAGLE